jgi:hypothetical protein
VHLLLSGSPLLPTSLLSSLLHKGDCCLIFYHTSPRNSQEYPTAIVWMAKEEPRYFNIKCDTNSMGSGAVMLESCCGILSFWTHVWLDVYTNTPLSSHLFCFESHEQYFSYLVTINITGDRAANLDLCLAFSSEGCFTYHTYCNIGPPFLRSYPKDPWFSLLNAMLLAKEQSLTILNVLGLTRLARAGLELTTSRMLSESTTTTLPQPYFVFGPLVSYL